MKEPLLVVWSQRPGRWQLVSVAPLSLRDQVLLFKCELQVQPTSQDPHALPSLFPSTPRTLFYRFRQWVPWVLVLREY